MAILDYEWLQLDAFVYLRDLPHVFAWNRVVVGEVQAVKQLPQVLAFAAHLVDKYLAVAPYLIEIFCLNQ